MFDWLFPVRRPASRVHNVSSSADSDAHQREDAPGALSRHHGADRRLGLRQTGSGSHASPESIQVGQACFGVIREEPPMYIGVGTLVLILIIILIVFLVRRV
jgi:hypothetical protein